MNSVESVNWETSKIKRIKFYTKERKCFENIENEYEPNLIKKLESEIYKLSVEPGNFNFDYDNDKTYYEVSGNNEKEHHLTEVVIKDITNESRLKRKINNYDSLVLLGEMTSGIIHDLGNQLMVILSATELLDKNINQKKSIELLKKTSKNAAELVQNLLSYIRNDVVRKTNVNLSDVIKEAVKFFKHLSNKNIKIIINGIDDDLFILSERKSILNVILNILINARDAIKNEGEILIDVKLVNLAYLPLNSAFYTNPKGSFYKISITDNGKGISEDEMANIFIPFYTTKKLKGTGLGLANASMIIEENQGVLCCKSQVDYGTTFDIYLKAINAYMNPNVLVISDDIYFLSEAKKCLKKFNYEFHYFARSVGEVFYEENFHEISYVISDKDFVGVDGLKVLITDIHNFKEKVSKFL